ncbi:ABC transporter transmembrane domain-containing protein [uncultured Dubosiella sp.]|uniref:ABC transporter transmembrane domain-containing protein n=1 Tax=uncultured Dubosiella sp. TaxID=1937011 RepID=UPI0025D904A0|nr:ABC transporter transmembrane domain-containing protein [uncultured Dubosiella sp.]
MIACEKIVQTIAQANKKRMIDQLFCIPYSTYEKYEKGDLQTRIFDDCDQVAHMLVYTVLPVVQVLLSVAFGLAYVLIYNWPMGVFTMLWIPLFTNGIRNAPDLFRKAS